MVGAERQEALPAGATTIERELSDEELQQGPFTVEHEDLDKTPLQQHL